MISPGMRGRVDPANPGRGRPTFVHRRSQARPAAALVLALLLILPGHGAPISWEAHFDITGADDLSTEGTLVEAVNTTSGGDSPTVDAGGESITFVAFDPGVSATGMGTWGIGLESDTRRNRRPAPSPHHPLRPTAQDFWPIQFARVRALRSDVPL